MTKVTYEYAAESLLNDITSQMESDYWDGGFNLMTYEVMVDYHAQKSQWEIVDKAEFNTDKYFYNWYKSTELGLS